MKGVLNAVVISAVLWVVILVIAGCSFKVEMGYHGKTGLDNEQFTDGGVKPAIRR